MATVEELLLKVSGDSRGGQRALTQLQAKANATLTTLDKKLKNVGSGMSNMGRFMTTYFTLPIVAAGAMAVKQAMNIESKWAEVRKVYDGSASDIKRLLEPAVKKLSLALGYQKAETLDALAAISAMGYKGSGAVDMLSQSMKFARLGNMDLNTAMETVVATSKIYNVQGAKLTKTLAVMNETENVSAASMQDLTWGIQEAGSVAKMAGVDVRELSAFMAVLRERATPAGEAAFALKSIFTKLRTPTDKAAKSLAQVGIVTDTTGGKVKEADKILQEIAGKWKGLTERQRENIATELAGIHQKGRFVSLIDDLSRKNSTYSKTLKQTADDNKNLAHYVRELNIFTEQSKVKWERLKVILFEVAEVAGKKILPVLLDVGKSLVGWIEKFNGLNPATQEFIIKLLALVAVAGPVLMFMGSMVSAVGSLIPIIKGLGAAFKFLTGPIGIVIAGLTAGYKAGEWIDNKLKSLGMTNADLRRSFTLLAGPGGALYNVVKGFQELPAKVEKLKAEFSKFTSFINRMPSIISNGISMMKRWFAQELPHSIGVGIGNAINYLKSLPSKVSSFFTNAKNTALNLASQLVNGVIAWIASLPGKIGSLLSGLPGKFKSSFQSSSSQAIGVLSGLLSFIGGLPGQFYGIASSIGASLWNGLKGWLKKVAQGIRDALNPKKKSSPSAIDLLTLGLKDAESRIEGSYARMSASGKKYKPTGFQLFVNAIKHGVDVAENKLEKLQRAFRKHRDQSHWEKLKTGIGKYKDAIAKLVDKIKAKLDSLKSSLNNSFDKFNSMMDTALGRYKTPQQKALETEQARQDQAQKNKERAEANADLSGTSEHAIDIQERIRDANEKYAKREHEILRANYRASEKAFQLAEAAKERDQALQEANREKAEMEAAARDRITELDNQQKLDDLQRQADLANEQFEYKKQLAMQAVKNDQELLAKGDIDKKEFIKRVKGHLGDIGLTFEEISGVMADLDTSFGTKLADLINAIGNAADKIRRLMGINTKPAPKTPTKPKKKGKKKGMAEGGVVWSPTEIPVAEKEPEIFTPFSKVPALIKSLIGNIKIQPAMAGASSSVNQTFNNNYTVKNEADAALLAHKQAWLMKTRGY